MCFDFFLSPIPILKLGFFLYPSIGVCDRFNMGNEFDRHETKSEVYTSSI